MKKLLEKIVITADPKIEIVVSGSNDIDVIGVAYAILKMLKESPIKAVLSNIKCDMVSTWR